MNGAEAEETMMRRRPLPWLEQARARTPRLRNALINPLAAPRTSCAERRRHASPTLPAGAYASLVVHLPADLSEDRSPACQPMGSPLTCPSTGWRITEFLIGTPRLEFRATPTKQMSDPISNRDTSRCLHSPSQTPFFLGAPFSRMAAFSLMRRPLVAQGRSAIPGCTAPRGKPPSSFPWPPRHSRHLGRLIANPGLERRLTSLRNTHLKISNRECIAVFQSGFYRHAPVMRHSSNRIGGPLITRHLSPITSFPIYGPAIRNPRKALKT